MKVNKTRLGAVLIHPDIHKDDRGEFSELFDIERYKDILPPTFSLDKINVSHSKHNVFRGLHFQEAPYAQEKLVTCIYGCVYDVIVDLRKDSLTYGQSESFFLSSSERTQIYVPSHLAHGFWVSTIHASVAYAVSGKWMQSHERTIAWNDPNLQASWMLGFNPILSAKDQTPNAKL